MLNSPTDLCSQTTEDVDPGDSFNRRGSTSTGSTASYWSQKADADYRAECYQSKVTPDVKELIYDKLGED